MNKTKFEKYLYNFFICILFLIAIFGRPFTGLFIFGFRLGEILVGLGTVVLLINLFKLKENNQLRELIIPHAMLLLIFIFYIIYDSFENFSTYSFKASSFIWMISYVYIGFSISQIKNINKIFPYFIIPLTLGFIFSFYSYPNIFIQFFNNYSDKFDFPKGSDLLLLLILSNYLLRNYFRNKDLYFYYFFISFSIFIPGLLFKSKGAFLPAVLWVLVEIILQRKYLVRHYIKSIFLIIVAILLFISSTLFIWGNLDFFKIAEKPEIEITEVISESLTNNIEKNKTNEIFYSLYIQDNRLYSTNITANWRLQIWQDVYHDLIAENKILFGYGYFEIIPAMDMVERRGTDGTNENVHNFSVNILARSGLIGLSIYIYLIYKLILMYFKKHNNYQIIHFIFPVLLTSFFDSSLESVRFPIIFYTFVGLIIGLENKYNNT